MLPELLSNCGLPEAPATTLPYPGNMAYWGGDVQVTPKVYLVYWGWGEAGAFPARVKCKAVTLKEGALSAKLKCDPDGAGARMADFVSQLGGTQWAGVSTQYFQTGSSGPQEHISNSSNALAGIWIDDRNLANLAGTSGSNPAGPTNTYTDLAAEAARAAKHFGVTNLANANFVIAQAPKFSDPNALEEGYCAFHDYTQPGLEHGWYNAIKPNISYTNMPYVLAIDTEPIGGGEAVNVCGENAANSGAAGKLDGISIVLGHEIEETVTDPGGGGHPGERYEHHEPRRLVRHSRRQRERRQVRVGGRAARRRRPRRAAGGAHPRCYGRHQGQRRDHVRGPVAVEQRSRCRRRLLRRSRHRPSLASPA
jgi:serine protease